MIEQVTPEQVRGMKEFLDPLFRKANGYFYDLMTTESVISDIEAGKMQCFIVGDLVIVTQVDLYPNGKVLRVILTAGKGFADHAKDLDDFLCEMGRLNACKAVVTGGRRGWEYFANQNGWKTFGEYRKELK